MMKIILLVFCLTAVATFGQEPDQWRGLVLDKATPDQAKQILGKPKSEKTSDKVYKYMTRGRGTGDPTDLVVLHWEKTEGFEDVKLYFLSGTLVMIQLEKPKDKIPAKVFVKAYKDVEFTVANRANSSAFYEVEATTSTSKIMAGVGNSTGSVMRGMFGGLITAGHIDKLEGNVMLIFIQSRRMDDTRGVDALK
jgi:hypothetical protein